MKNHLIKDLDLILMVGCTATIFGILGDKYYTNHKSFEKFGIREYVPTQITNEYKIPMVNKFWLEKTNRVKHE